MTGDSPFHNTRVVIPRFSPSYILLFSVFVVASCAIVYELLISTVASYLRGDTILQFSVTIGLFLTSMGLGSWVSRYLLVDLVRMFILIELFIGLIGGLCVPVLFWTFGIAPDEFPLVMYIEIVMIGGLIGLELPLVTRILSDSAELRINLSNVLSFDYLGGLLGSLAFPLVLLPELGMVRTSLIVGLLNAIVAGATFLSHRRLAGNVILTGSTIAGALLALLILFIASDPLSAALEQRLYRDPIVLSAQSPYQQIVVTKWHDDIRLFLDGHLQFSSVDEYRYHESLVLPALASSKEPANVLIIGGGDGLAARDALLDPAVRQVTLVELDPMMTELFQQQPMLAQLNDRSLSSPRIKIINADGFEYLRSTTDQFGVIIADLPDPRTEALQKLYTREFYAEARDHLLPGGRFETQATSPYYTRQAFWCIVATIGSVWPAVLPLHADVASFGDWGFVLAGDTPVDLAQFTLPEPTRFLTQARFTTLPVFGADVLQAQDSAKVNTLLNPVLPTYYDAGWQQFYR